MKTNTPPSRSMSAYLPKNECLRCNRYIGGKCLWTKGDYCRILKSK